MYSHRNGEIEPPTVNGWYWFDGNHYDVRCQNLVAVRSFGLFPTWLEGWSEPETFEGKWYGPLVAPWDAPQPDSAQAMGAVDVLDAMDRLLDTFVGMFDDDANNMPDQVLDNYLTVRAWTEQHSIVWRATLQQRPATSPTTPG